MTKAAAARQLVARLPPSPVPALAAEPTAKPRASGKTHTVKAGDSLWTIARRYQLNVERLAAANGLKPSSVLQPGQKIALGAPRATEASKSAKSATPGKPAKAATSARPQPYTVRQGDSLWTIARQFKVTVKDLQRWNRLKPKQNLKPGQALVVAPAP